MKTSTENDYDTLTQVEFSISLQTCLLGTNPFFSYIYYISIFEIIKYFMSFSKILKIVILLKKHIHITFIYSQYNTSYLKMQLTFIHGTYISTCQSLSAVVKGVQ